uniref:Putative HNH homing endonuclease n=1 Tax=Staurocarteria crucifera TaxID=47781 RepID=A0A0S2ICL9_9CHLO|nr:putative HNH homing endonuclease [Carteria crucifera]
MKETSMSSVNPTLEAIAAERNHTILIDTNPRAKTSGNITIKCHVCQQTSTVEKKSYLNSVQGCRTCKANNTSKAWRGKTRKPKSDYRETPRQIKMRNPTPAPEYEAIGNREDLVRWLENKNDPYCIYILSCMQKYPSPPSKKPVGFEGHHIIPIHANGPHVPWNLIWLPREDHFIAHQIRAEVYSENGDKRFLRLKSTPRGKRNYGPAFSTS